MTKRLTLVLLSLFAVAVLPSQSFGARVDSLIVRGNFRSNARLIKQTSGISIGDDVTPGDARTSTMVQMALRNIYALGVFHDVRISHEMIAPGREKVIIEVEEFPVLNQLSISGEDEISEEDLLNKIRLASGQLVTPQALKRVTEEILTEYRAKGHYLASIVPEQTPVPGGQVDLNLNIDEGARVQVQRIRFIGADAIPHRKLKDEMETNEDRWWRSADFDEEKYREDKNKIIAFYRKHGYREAYIQRDSIYLSDDRSDLFIDIWINEGRQYHYGRISWEGNVLLSDPEMHGMLSLSEGDVYNREAFDEAVFNVHSAYQEQGYWAAMIDPVEIPRNDTIDIRFTVVEGEPSRVNFVDILGNDKTKDKVIRRELTVVPGDVFRRSALERSHRNVFYLNYFENVEPDIRPLPTGNVDVVLRVREKPTGTVNMSVGYGEVDKWVGSIGLSIPNLMGNGQQLDFQWEFGQTKTSFYLSFTEPWLFDTPTSGTISLFNTRQELTVTEESRGFSLRIGRRLRWPDDYSRIYGRYSFTSETYTFPSSFTYAMKASYLNDPNDPTLISSSFGVTYVRDSRNLPMFPTQGSYFSYDFSIAGGPLGGDVAYRRHMVEVAYHLPLFSIGDWTPALALKSTFGQINSSSPLNVPLGERFRPGGISYDGQIRGYPDYYVGPRDASGNATGGFTMLINSAEVSFPIVDQQIYALAFADAGNAWRSLSEMNPYEMRRSLGVGVRFILPLAGVIGLDFAYGYDRTNLESGAQWETHFQFGQAAVQ